MIRTRTLTLTFALTFILATISGALGQAVNAPQYSVNLSFLGGSIYGQNAAMDTTFSDQFTTNTQLQGDFLVIPGAGYTGYFGGGSYNIAALCPILATTSLSCGKFIPFATLELGLGRIALNNAPTSEGVAGIAEIGANYDPTGQGKYSVIFKGGYGDFGPSVAGLSNKGLVFYSGISFGGGSNAAATQAKIARMRDADTRKALKYAKAQAKIAAKAAKLAHP